MIWLLGKGEFEINNYEINTETLIIFPYGNGKSKVYEYDSEHIVHCIPLNIIEYSCLFFGASLEGRKAAVKEMLGIDMKVPILIEDSNNIIFFPITNCVHKSSIWISYQNLLKYSKLDEFSTVLYFHNNKQLVIDVKYNLIDNQVIRCAKLDTLLNKRRNFLKKENLVIDEKSIL